MVSSRVAAESEKCEFKTTPIEPTDELERREGLGESHLRFWHSNWIGGNGK